MAENYGKYASMGGVALAVIYAFFANPMIAALVLVLGLVTGYTLASGRAEMKTYLSVLIAAVIGLGALAGNWSSLAATFFFVPSLMVGVGVFLVFTGVAFILTHLAAKHK